ncbi:MAG: hypothetical protein ACE5GL_03850, partial [Calditrichia bacterium]
MRLYETTERAYIKLSDFGKIVDDEWNKSFEIRHELHCDEYIIMPNHLHAIVVLKKPKSGNFNDSTDLHGSDESVARPQIFRKPKSLSSFIGGFKSAINTKIDNYIDENHLD